MGNLTKGEDFEAAQLKLAAIIKRLIFGHVGGLRVRDGLPVFDPPPHIVQAIRLGSRTPHRDSDCAESTLQAEFSELFDHLAHLRDGIVDIDVRHGLPFRLVFGWRSITPNGEGHR
jgi:hypothetical protein